MTRTCPVCEKGQLSPVDDIESEFSGYIFVEHGLRCGQCGEEFIDPKDSERTIQFLRQRNLWGTTLRLRRKLSRSGRGIVLRIPRDLEESLQLKGSEEVMLSKAGKRRILIEVSEAK